MALSVTLTMKKFENSSTTLVTETKTDQTDTTTVIEGSSTTATMTKLEPSRSLGRFLAEKETRNPRAASHCHKNKQMCEKIHGKGWKCCNNKCVNLMNDRHNCGECKKKCKYTGECCRGECVDVAYDKRHCGRCNNRCKPGKFCVYGMCEYAWYIQNIFKTITKGLLVYPLFQWIYLINHLEFSC